MPTRRSARVRAADALRTTDVVNETQDENNLVQTRKRGDARKPAPKGKENIPVRKDPPRTKTPLRDVTNNARITRSRRQRKAIDKPSGPAGESEINNDHGITTTRDKRSTRSTRSTRRKNQRAKPSVASEENRSVTDPHEETELADVENSPAQNIQSDAAGAALHSRQDDDSIRTSQTKDKRITPTEHEAELEALPSSDTTDEIQPNVPKADSRAQEHESEPSADEIQPNSPEKKRRTTSLLSEASDEIQPEPARNKRSSGYSLAGSGVRSPSPAISDLPPLSPLKPTLPSEIHQASWMTENHELNSADLDTTRPRQAVYTYGKRRRLARVSLPTMQALGVRAKSPSSESQSGSEKDGDENLSDAYAESEDESEQTPKRNPKLQAFVTEQKKLWQEVDDMDLLVESD